jgi:hypothetical protein
MVTKPLFLVQMVTKIHQLFFGHNMKAKTKSKKQVGYLLSKGSPLSSTQQSKLKRELHSGKVKVSGKKK